MGIDLHGWIEVRTAATATWLPAVWLDVLASRNTDLFGALFGVGSTLFRPLAFARGLPADVSQTVRRDAGVPFTLDGTTSLHESWWGDTWITWSEILAADPDEPADGLWLFQREPGPLGTPVESWTNLPYDPAQVGRRWEEDGVSYWVVHPRRRDLMTDDADWQAVVELSTVLARRFGAAHVRWVVWFGA
jgi:hypothetical protein